MLNRIYRSQLRVQIGDINYGGHLGHDRLITLLHQARLDFLQQLSAYAGAQKQSCAHNQNIPDEADCFGVGLIMRRLQVEYLAEAFLRDALVVEMQVSDVKMSRFVLSYRVLRDETLIASAQTMMVAFDYQARKVCALPEAFLQALQNEEK